MAQALKPNVKLVSDAIISRSALKSGEPVQAKTLRTRTLVVEHMHCGNCMRKVESALLAVPGVVGARTNLSTGRVAVVSTVQSNATLEPLIEAVCVAGYKAHELSADNRVAKPDDSDLVRRLAVAGFAATNIMMLSVAVWSGHGGDMAASLQAMLHWLSALIAVPAVAYAGMPFFVSAAAALKARRINMDVPISLGVLLATAMSLYQTMRGSEQVYFDAAAALLFFLLIGRVLDQRMRRQATGAAENLLGLLSPATTIRHRDGSTERVATRTVIPGMALIIAAGERVPVDARMTLGTADMDESLMTGETRPRIVIAGDPLYAGTVNLSGPVEAIAIACEENTLLAEITRLMHTAEQARGRYVRLADQAARLYAPAVHILGLATFFGWLWAGYGWEPALTAAIAVLIITCPCALALAVPAVQVAAIGRLFKHGIVVKASDGLERLAEVDTIVLDKTGTLTLGEPRLVTQSDIDDAALAKAASLAVVSRHPYARAIVRAAQNRGLSILSASDVVEVPGAGLQAVIGAQVIKLGSAAFCDLGNGEGNGPGLWLREGAATPVAFFFDDPLRHDAPAVVAKLAKLGYHVELLSGDQTTVVASAALASGIVTWRAQVRPDDKAHHIDALTAKGRKVLMVGDGLNDALALASGHASIAPSTAADISQTASDAIFQGDMLAPLLEILAVAKAARSAALANFAIAIGYNVLFVPLAIIGVVTPLVAAIAMSVSSVTVTANAIWLGHKRLRDIQ
jgi:P-type Cu2+ transporter